MKIEELLEREDLIEVGRKAVEDLLVDFRESRLSLLGARNGLVIREADGKDSHIVRLSIKQAIVTVLKAVLEETKK